MSGIFAIARGFRVGQVRSAGNESRNDARHRRSSREKERKRGYIYIWAVECLERDNLVRSATHINNNVASLSQ